MEKMRKTYRPMVSIVIPAYNASNYLAEAIESALEQTYDNTEIIVVNDGSADDGKTEETALAYGNKIRYFRKENGGSSSALNYGIRKMHGEWFSWLSHDDLYYPDRIEREIHLLESLDTDEGSVRKHIVFCGAELVRADGSRLNKPGRKKLERLSAKLEGMENNALLVAGQMGDYNFHGCGCMVHKSVFDAVGMFDEKLKLLNDADMWFRIYSAGYRVHFVPEVLVKGRVHAKQVSTVVGYSWHNPEQDAFWERSLDFLLKHYGSDWDAFYRFGTVAFRKGRTGDGDRAFAVAGKILPGKRFYLRFQKTLCLAKGNARNLFKRVYLIFVLNK